MRNAWAEYFTFNKRERRGVLVMTVLNLSVLVLLVYKPIWLPAEQFPSDKVQRLNPHFPDIPKSAGSFKEGPFIKTKFKRNFQKEKLELNSADSLDLVLLRGIGPSFAKRILKYRERLGGFVTLCQLKEVYGMDSTRYQCLCEQVSLDVSRVVTICINTVPKDSLRLHPYFRWNLANLIVSYREKHGPYKQIEDLRRLDLVNDSVYSKIAPYCRVQ